MERQEILDNIKWYSVEDLRINQEIYELQYPGVYVMKCTVTDDIYIGSTTRRIRQRWSELRKVLRTNNYKKCSRVLCDYWKKYKEEDFKFGVLEVTDNGKVKEQEWIDKLKPELNVNTNVTIYSRAQYKEVDNNRERCFKKANSIKEKLKNIEGNYYREGRGKEWVIRFDNRQLRVKPLKLFCEEYGVPYRLLHSLEKDGKFYKEAGLQCYKI